MGPSSGQLFVVAVIFEIFRYSVERIFCKKAAREKSRRRCRVISLEPSLKLDQSCFSHENRADEWRRVFERPVTY